MIPVYLYSDTPSQSLVIEDVADFLSNLGLSVEFRGDFLSYLSLGTGRLPNSNRFYQGPGFLILKGPLISSNRICRPRRFEKELYDGFWVQRIFSRFFLRKHPGELIKDSFHAVITGRLLGTYGARRYHARVIISGFPSFVSTSGLVEGPARPREYYFLKAEFIRSGRDLGELDEMFRGKFVDYQDEKITKITGPYVLQPLLHHFSGKEFCENGGCALFNSHWQKEVLEVQYTGLVCAECRSEIRKITGR